MVEIRLSRDEDTAACAQLARAAYARYVPLIGREPPPMLQDFASDIAAGRCWVAGAPPLAYVVAYRRGNAWLLENVAVAPDVQGQGLGRALIAHVEALALADGAAALELYTNAKMTANLAIYPKLGFIETGRRTEQGLDRVYFVKPLRESSERSCG